MTRLSRLTLVYTAFLAPFGCASRAKVRSQQAEIDQLRGQLAAVQKEQRDERGEQESIRNEMFILHDRVETARTALARAPSAPPKLEVVKLAPTSPEPRVVANDPLAIRVKPAAKAAPSDAAAAAADPNLADEAYDPSADEAEMFSFSGDDGAAADASDAIRLTTPGKPEKAAVRPVPPIKMMAEPQPHGTPVVVASVSPSLPEAPEVAGPVVDPSGDPMKMYQRAFSLFQAKRWNDAIAAFREFVAAHPKHEYADNALYWIGECFYTQQDYSKAIAEFQKIPELYPGGNKVPDAMLKIGIAYLGLDDKRSAQKTLTQLIDAYPQSSAAGIGRQKLAKISPE